MKRNLERLCTLECKLLTEIETREQALNPEEMGMLVDMVKDIAEAKKDCYKAEYYKEAAEELERAEMRARYGNQELPMGYDSWRYKSSGRFAPEGSGTHYGYIPEDMMYPPKDNIMGYPHMMDGSIVSDHITSAQGNQSVRGYTYDKYKAAKQMGSTDRMGHHTDEYLTEVAQSIKEMWGDADPDHRKKMKASLTKLVGELA